MPISLFLKLKYNNRTRIYKGKQVDVYLDGKKVAMDKTKGVVLNKTLMVSYKDVFKKSLRNKDNI